MPTEDHVRQLGAIAEQHDLVLIEDQAYEKFTHIDRAVTSVGSVDGLWERTLISYTLHKNYTLHAWRAGFLAGPAHLMEQLLTVSVWINMRVNHVTQAVAAAALNGPQEWVQDMVQPFRDGRNMIYERLADNPGITMDPPVEGGSMGYIRVDGLGLPSTEVAHRLLYEFGVPTVPGAVLGAAKPDSGEYVRIAFKTRTEWHSSYEEVVDRLEEASVALAETALSRPA